MPVEPVPMSTNDGSALITNAAVESLERLDSRGRDLCPDDRQPAEWAGEVLDDLSRIAALLEGAVTQVSGRGNDTVAQQARGLATVIAAHRNVELGHPDR